MQNFKSSDNRDSDAQHEDAFDFVYFIGILWSRKKLILLITGLFAFISFLYILLATPIYKATAMIQVEENSGSVPGFENLGSMFEGHSKSITEIELLKSRKVIGEVVDTLKLDIIAKPFLYPIIGGALFRSHESYKDGALADAKFGAIRYAWGGESIDIFRLELPIHLIGKELTLRVEDEQQVTLYYKNNILLQGSIAKDLQENNILLSVRSISAREGTEFKIKQSNRLATIINLQQQIQANEKGRDSGIIDISYNNEDPDLAKAILNKVAEIYVQQNVERNSAEAQKSLDFLKFQLPEVKKQLEDAEQKFNDYQIRQKSVNISLETQGVLEQLVELETKLQELELNRLQMSRLFKSEHPLYKGVLEQIELVSDQKNELSNRVTALPETQQELLRYTRDVEVSSQIYVMLLGKVQELDIIRAGTVGNVRVIDRAIVNLDKPIKPRKEMIIFLGSLGGFILISSIVVFQNRLNNTLRDPNQLESIGIPIYANIPNSPNILKKESANNKNKEVKSGLLVQDYPNDLAVEAIRSLRTSLQFAMLDVKNKIICISGPGPNVGKSFITANLGAVIAQSNKKVLLIDADLRRGDLQKQLGLHFEAGVTGYLSGRYQLKEVIRTTFVDGMDIIPRGIVAPNPSELLLHNRFAELIHYADSNYDAIIIDTPPILAVTDPAIISKHAGITLIVSRFGLTNRKEVEVTQKRFEQNGVIVKGLIFNALEKSKIQSYSYYGAYNYDYSPDVNNT